MRNRTVVIPWLSLARGEAGVPNIEQARDLHLKPKRASPGQGRGRGADSGVARGDDVAFEADDANRDIDALGLAAGPATSRIRWIGATNLDNVPVDAPPARWL
jgi:hypothetical protein